MDRFANHQDSVSNPARDARAVTPSDSDPLAETAKALYIGTGGNVAIVPMSSDDVVVFRNVPNGAILPVRARAVHADGTTAADIVALL